MTDYTFTPNNAIIDTETHEKVIELFNNIEAHGKKSRFKWEEVPPEEEYIESCNIIFDSEEFYSPIDDYVYKTPWKRTLEILDCGKQLHEPRFSSEEKYKEFLEDRKNYRNSLNAYIFAYAKSAPIYKNKLLEFQSLKFKEFDNLLGYIKQLSEEKNVILKRFIYSFTDIELKYSSKSPWESEPEIINLEKPIFSFGISFALVDK
jgi:hypothetical protein